MRFLIHIEIVFLLCLQMSLSLPSPNQIGIEFSDESKSDEFSVDGDEFIVDTLIAGVPAPESLANGQKSAVTAGVPPQSNDYYQVDFCDEDRVSLAVSFRFFLPSF